MASFDKESLWSAISYWYRRKFGDWALDLDKIFTFHTNLDKETVSEVLFALAKVLAHMHFTSGGTEDGEAFIYDFLDEHFSQTSLISLRREKRDSESIKQQFKKELAFLQANSIPVLKDCNLRDALEESCDLINKYMLWKRIRVKLLDVLNYLVSNSLMRNDSEDLLYIIKYHFVFDSKMVELKSLGYQYDINGKKPSSWDLVESDAYEYVASVPSLIAYHLRRIDGNIESELSLAREFLRQNYFSFYLKAISNNQRNVSIVTIRYEEGMLDETVFALKVKNWRYYCVNVLYAKLPYFFRVELLYVLYQIYDVQDGLSDEELEMLHNTAQYLRIEDSEIEEIESHFFIYKEKKKSTESFVEYIQNTKADMLKVLHLDELASLAEIKKAYRHLAKQYHPDRQPKDATPEELEAAKEKFLEIDKAYDYLISLYS